MALQYINLAINKWCDKKNRTTNKKRDIEDTPKWRNKPKRTRNKNQHKQHNNQKTLRRTRIPKTHQTNKTPKKQEKRTTLYNSQTYKSDSFFLNLSFNFISCL